MSDEQEEQPQEGGPSIFEGLAAPVADDIVSLVELGHIEESFDFCGTTFVMRTLRLNEDFAVGVAAKEWADSAKEVQAWATAHVALSVQSINDDDAFCPPLGPGQNLVAYAKARLKWFSTQYHWPVINYLYEKYNDLLTRQEEAFKAAQDF